MPQAGGKASSARYWWIVVAGFVGVALCQTPMVFLTVGAFAAPLNEAFGWNRPTVSLAISVSALALAVASPFAGAFIDKYGPRPVLMTSLVLMALGLMSLSLLTDSLWHFLGVYALIGVLGAGANTMPYARVLTGWFDKRRGLVMGLSMSALGLGGDIGSFVAENITAAFDWRTAYVGLGLMILLIALPLAYFVMRETPPDPAHASPGAVSRAGLTRAEAFRTPEFWLMLVIFFLTAATLHGIQIHMVSVLRHNGLDDGAAVTGAMFFGLGLVVGRIGCGFLFDYKFAPHVAFVAFLGSLLGMGFISQAVTPESAMGIAFLTALGTGAETAMLGYLVSRYFGFKAFGVVYGCIFGADMLGTAVGIYLWGLNYEAAGSYGAAQWVSFACIAIICLALYKLRPFPRWSDETA